MSAWDLILWGVLPYVTIVLLVAGTTWRWRYDRFGWTTRSSELYESRLLRIGSPLFHFGLLFVLAGHVLGLVLPAPGSASTATTSPRSPLGAWRGLPPSPGSPSSSGAAAAPARCSWPPPATTS